MKWLQKGVIIKPYFRENWEKYKIKISNVKHIYSALPRPSPTKRPPVAGPASAKFNRASNGPACIRESSRAHHGTTLDWSSFEPVSPSLACAACKASR